MVLGVDKLIAGHFEQNLHALGGLGFCAPVQTRAALGIADVDDRLVMLQQYFGKLSLMELRMMVTH